MKNWQWIGTLLVIAGVCPLASGQDVDLSQLKGLRCAADYQLTANGRAIPVLETIKTTNHGTNDVNRMSFASFDCDGDGETTVDLTVHRAFESFELRPRRSGIQVHQDDNILSFSIRPSQNVVVVFDRDYDNAVVIAANPIHAPPQPSEVEHYFEPGIHQLRQRLSLQSDDDVYLADGAILLGAFDLKNVRNVRIFGRGIVYGGELPHQENYRVFAGDNTKNVTIEGITVCNAPGWIVSFWNGSEKLTVRNVKMVGNFRYNTDGVQTGTNGLLVEDCFLQCNDDNFSLNGVCTNVVIRRNALWNLYNGGVFMMGWATGARFHLENLRVYDNTVIRCGGCCDYDRKGPFSMKLFGSQRLARDIEFRNIVLEDIAAFGRWIDLQADEANDCTVSDIRFIDIQVDDTWRVEGEVRGMKESNPITGLVFHNVWFGDQLMDRPEVGQLSLINTSGTRIQQQTFEDVALARQPIPESAARMATRTSGQSPQDISAASSRSILLGPNLLRNSDFADGLQDWTTPPVGSGAVTIRNTADSQIAVVTSRRDGSVGIRRDVTELLQKLGPGTYNYGVAAKGLSSDLHVQATLVIENEKGTQKHPSPDVVVNAQNWGIASRLQSVSWATLKRAELRIESGYEDAQDFTIREVFLKKVDR